MGNSSITWYVAIKLGEWVIWSGIGIYFLIQTFRYHARPRWLYLALAVAFFVFGLADFIEYFTNGTFPWWLRDWKIAGGTCALCPPRGSGLCEKRPSGPRAVAFFRRRVHSLAGDLLHREVVGGPKVDSHFSSRS